MSQIGSSMKFLLPFATAVGAWGGFPRPPKFFIEATKHPLIKYFLVFVLTWQGGSNQDAYIALAMTFVLFIIATVAEWREETKTLQGAPAS